MKEILISDIIALHKIEEVVRTSLKSFKGLSCYLFGSYPKGKAKRSSDAKYFRECF